MHQCDDIYYQWFRIAASTSDYVALLETTISVTDWYSLGLLLGLGSAQLERIRMDYQNTNDCRMAMISRWLDTANASWRALVRALVSPLMGKRNLAMKIAANHTKREKAYY